MKSTIILLAAVSMLMVGAGGYAVVGGTAEMADRAHAPIMRTDLEGGCYPGCGRNNWPRSHCLTPAAADRAAPGGNRALKTQSRAES
jgi:hypothetical protein